MNGTGPVDAGPVSLYVEEHGSGDPPVLLIQGLGYAVWAWQKQIPALSERRRVIAIDNRGAGRSDKPPGPYSIDEMADDAAFVLRELANEPAHVVGLSMGGYIAQALAYRHSELVRSLVLASTAAGGGGAVATPESTLELWLAHAGKPPREYARATAWLSFAPGWTDEHADEYARLIESRLEYPTPPGSWRAQYDACTVFLEAGVPVEELHVPTLVLHGDADRIVPVDNAYNLGDRIPGAEIVVLPGRGHVAPLEEPEEWNGIVSDFLARVEGAA